MALLTVNKRDWAATAVYSIIFLFFFQLMADFIAAIYAFGLMGTSIPPEIVAVLLLFSPILLLIWRDGMGKRPFLILSGIILVSRLIEVMLDTRGQMLVSGVGVAAFLVWFPAWLWRLSRQNDEAVILPASGLVGGVVLSVLFRAWGSGTDLSMTGGFQLMGWLLAAVTAVLLPRQIDQSPVSNLQPSNSPGIIRPVIGLTSVLILLYFAFTSPNVMARWTGASYPAVVTVLLLALVGFAALLAVRPHLVGGLKPGVLWAWNGLFLVSLTVTIWLHQIRFPADPGAYPLYETAVTPALHIPLYLTLILFPVLFVDFAWYTHDLAAKRPSLPALGKTFALASLYLLIMIFAHVFTTVYDYIPVIGPFFRDKFWLVYFAAGLGLLLPMARPAPAVLLRLPAGWVAGLAAAAIAGTFLTAARPTPPQTPALSEAETAVRILTYNVQQGYSAAGQKNFDGQLDLIRAIDADIIGLQESDTNRIAGGNADLVRYFADNLDMYAYYGPKTVPGTFGIALLSRYPIENPRTFYMFSEGEQTATIEAQITIAGQVLNIFVTHLGNGGPIVQQEAILQVAVDKEDVILLGDFNFRPDSKQYALTTGVSANGSTELAEISRRAVFDDAWLRRWPEGSDNPDLDPGDRIDHIFISPEIRVAEAEYIFSPASDHPAATAVLILND